MKRVILMTLLIFVVVGAIGISNEEPVKVSIESYKVWDSRTATSTFEALEEVFPGDEIMYILSYENTSDSAIRGLQMIGMIPEGTHYINGSATGERREHYEWEVRDVELQFSIDNGSSFSRPPIFFEEILGGMTVKKLVNPSTYTNILWLYSGDFKPLDILKICYRVKINE
jgi:uncharacterized repeat protein (TIGR01451 family)